MHIPKGLRTKDTTLIMRPCLKAKVEDTRILRTEVLDMMKVQELADEMLHSTIIETRMKCHWAKTRTPIEKERAETEEHQTETRTVLMMIITHLLSNH